MTTLNKVFLTDAEAAVYAMEAATCLVASVAEGNWAQAVLDTVSLVGWVKNCTSGLFK